MFTMWEKSNFLEGSRFTCLDRKSVFEMIRKEFIRNFRDTQMFVMITNTTKYDDVFLEYRSTLAANELQQVYLAIK